MRDIDPVSIRLFLAALEEGSIARAAAREAIVPSAVSKRISEMEAELKVTLLDRSVRACTPRQPARPWPTMPATCCKAWTGCNAKWPAMWTACVA